MCAKLLFSNFPVQVYNTLIGNGYCNDETNNAENKYDGGDCCGYNVDTEYCVVCECYLEDACIARVHPFVGDGYCNDVTNTASCGYDGGDCCGSCVIKTHCSDCTCMNPGSNNGYSTAIGNGFCNDETNTAACNYDGGDCCGNNVNSIHCSQCKCYNQEVCEAGVTHTYVGDGYCNDETNIAACMYDGLECCGSSINTEHCSDCKCHGMYQ